MKQSRKLTTLVVIILSVMLISACAAKPTVDPNQKMTEIAATVQAQLTLSAPPTPTNTFTPEAPTATLTITPALPTNTPQGLMPTATQIVIPSQPANSTDNAKFVADITIPDGTTLKPGEQFTKTWRFQNTGKTTWTTDYAIQYLEGNLVGRNNTLTFNLTKPVPPGEFADISVLFTAPTAPGTYSSYWKLLSASGYYFGEVASVTIMVGTSTTTVAVPTTTKTPTPTATTETVAP